MGGNTNDDKLSDRSFLRAGVKCFVFNMFCFLGNNCRKRELTNPAGIDISLTPKNLIEKNKS
jgi:hypothetical protein